MAEIDEEVAAAPRLGRPAARARARARRAVPGPLAGRRPGRRPGRGPAHGRRRHLHRPGGAGRLRAGRRAPSSRRACARSSCGTWAGVTHQVSQSASAVSRALHIVDDRLRRARAPGRGPAVPAAGVVEAPGLHGARRLVGRPALAAVAKAPGRVLHAASGDGWLVRALAAAGGDAYGVDPRPTSSTGPSSARRPARGGAGRAPAGRGRRPASAAIVLSGVVDGHDRRRARQLLDRLADRLAPGGTLVVHSLSRPAWDAADAPPEADLAPGRPLRPETWATCCGWAATRRRRSTGPAGPTTWSPPSAPAITSPYAPAEPVSAAAGGPVAVHQFVAGPDPARRHRQPHPAAAPRPAGGRVALGDLRRGHPRRPGREASSLEYPEHAADGRRRRLPVLDLVGGGRYLAEPGRPWSSTTTTSPARSYYAGWEPRTGRGPRGRPRSWPCWRPRALSGWPTALSTRRTWWAGCRRTAVVPVLVDYGRLGERPTPGWRPSWPRPRPAAAPTGCSSGGSCPPRASTSWSRPCGPTGGSTTPQARLHLVGGTSSFEYPKALRGFMTTSA